MIIFWVTYEKYQIQKQYYDTIDFSLPNFISIFASNFRIPSKIDFHPISNKIYP